MTHSPDLASRVRALAPSNVGYFRNTLHRPGETCLVCLDDTWIGGGHVQSTALAARASGASTVSALILARWLEPSYTTTTPHLSSLRAGPDFDAEVCPWTGGVCPGKRTERFGG